MLGGNEKGDRKRAEKGQREESHSSRGDGIAIHTQKNEERAPLPGGRGEPPARRVPLSRRELGSKGVPRGGPPPAVEPAIVAFSGSKQSSEIKKTVGGELHTKAGRVFASAMSRVGGVRRKGEKSKGKNRGA